MNVGEPALRHENRTGSFPCSLLHLVSYLGHCCTACPGDDDDGKLVGKPTQLTPRSRSRNEGTHLNIYFLYETREGAGTLDPKLYDFLGTRHDMLSKRSLSEGPVSTV